MTTKKNKSLGVNAILNAVKSGLSVIFPLISYPYAFRVLHAEGIGSVNYSSSIVGYFGLIASLGISVYAIREGAKLRDDKFKLNDFCSQILTINVITTIIAYILLLICVFTIGSFNNYKSIILLLSLSIGFTTFGIEWVNTIFEDYLYITLRSIIIYVVSLFLLFALVKDQNDVLIYAGLTVISNGIICVSNWIYCRKYVTIKIVSKSNIKEHIKPILIIFANSVATSIYVNTDTTILGFLSGNYYVGIYSLAVKVYTVVKTMIAAIYSVFIPRISYYFGQNNKIKIKDIFTSASSAVILILLPASIGLVAIAREIVLFMGGDEYLEATLSLQILSISLVGAVLGGLLSYCLNIPSGREKTNVKATAFAALINICLNFVFIPLFKNNGAAITTVIAEFFVMFYCLFSFKDIKSYIDFTKLRNNLLQSLLGCVLIIIISVLVKYLVVNYLLRIILIFLSSVIAYSLELIILKNEFALKILARFQRC